MKGMYAYHIGYIIEDKTLTQLSSQTCQDSPTPTGLTKNGKRRANLSSTSVEKNKQTP